MGEKKRIEQSWVGINSATRRWLDERKIVSTGKRVNKMGKKNIVEKEN